MKFTLMSLNGFAIDIAIAIDIDFVMIIVIFNLCHLKDNNYRLYYGPGLIELFRLFISIFS